MVGEIVAGLVVPAIVLVILRAKHPKDDPRTLERVSRTWLAEHLKGDWLK